MYPSETNCHTVTVTGGQDSGDINFGNRFVDPNLEITKSNNASSSLAAGNTVEYRIKLSVKENGVNGLTVTDLPPEGFKYRVGSFRVFKNGIDITPLVSEPVYHSPGVWELGAAAENDQYELVYLADISGDQDPGVYNDLAWAKGTSLRNSETTYLAEVPGTDASFVDSTFAGTQVTIDKNLETTASVSVEKKVETTGQVLGASTSLPATGANENWLYLSAILAALGGFSIYYGIKKNYE
jgi:LPXTG-motif cell wall-anchored protein